MHPLIGRTAEAVAALAPAEPFELRGAWSRSTRTANDAEVIDARWAATAACAQPLAGLAFLQTESALYWVKSPPAVADLELSVSLHAYADFTSGTATFGAGIGTSFLPGVPVRCGPELEAACVMGRATAQTGRAHLVAEVDGTAFVVLLIPGALVKTGRNRLWHLRDAFAAQLPDDVRELLTRGRSGSLHD